MDKNQQFWFYIIQLTAKEGLPLALALIKKWTSKAEPTDADYDELAKLAAQSGSDRMTAKLQEAGIDPQSEQGKRFLTLVNV